MGIVIYPAGLMNLMRHIKDEYMDPEIYIMENGNQLAIYQIIYVLQNVCVCVLSTMI